MSPSTLRLDELAEQQAKVNEKLRDQLATLKAVTRRLDTLDLKLRGISPNAIRAAESRVQELSERLAGLIDRITVATELAHYLRRLDLPGDQRAELMFATVWAFDLPDTWWQEGLKDELDITDWLARCSNCYSEYRESLSSAAAN
jgi:hypothetical protein